jgi:hypothetical protein
MAKSSLLFALILIAMVVFVGYTVNCCLSKVITAVSAGCF